ncbi:MAG: DegT/DnrJ/EryC1/StrS family aminotransferase [Cytophagales bacterium]|nr:MAG: DegT/DnrJ/EryC1/StrS family aminotransferase [Cytophagales bacterium]
MVDLQGQYAQIKTEVLRGIEEVIESAAFIQGKAVKDFSQELAQYTGAKFVIPCANGTDALQIALMALNLQPDDEIILPAFTYIATVEVAALLKLKMVLVEVDENTFNIDPEALKKAITPKTKVIIPVHLYGQCANMEAIMEIAQANQLYVIEDTAQAIGSVYTFKNNIKKQAGTMGTIGTTSFFPSKNLGCYGDGGAIFTDDEHLAKKMQMIANHGQEKKYYHDIIGINSRLDTLQAAILRAKLPHLDTYSQKRQDVADYYDAQLASIDALDIPSRNAQSTHVFHQYTLKINDGRRDALKKFLEDAGIPTMIYYPLPIHFQKAFHFLGYQKGAFPLSESLCEKVISLPIHTEMETSQMEYIVEKVISFFQK